MGKILILALVTCFLSGVALGMYKEDTSPSEKDKQYMVDKEDVSSITMPERKTLMSEPIRDIRDMQKENPEQDFVEDNVTEEMRSSLND